MDPSVPILTILLVTEEAGSEGESDVEPADEAQGPADESDMESGDEPQGYTDENSSWLRPAGKGKTTLMVRSMVCGYISMFFHPTKGSNLWDFFASLNNKNPSKIGSFLSKDLPIKEQIFLLTELTQIERGSKNGIGRILSLKV